MMAKNQRIPISWPMPLKAMMAERPKKNQYPAYAVKSDDGEIEEH
jgi:hypothetical protein